MNQKEFKKIKKVLENIYFHLNKDEYPFLLNDSEHQKFLEAMSILNLNKKEKPIPEQVAIDYVRSGNAYFVKKKYKEALDNYSKAIEANPLFLKAYLNRAFVYNKLFQLDKAILDFNFVIKLEPKCDRAYSGIAISYYYNSDFHACDFKDDDLTDKQKEIKQELNYSILKSIENFSKSIELKPNNAYSYNGKGWVHYCQNKYTEAIESFDKAIFLEPSFKSAYYNRGLSYSSIGNHIQAINDFTKGISIPFFNDWLFYLSRSISYNAIGKKTEAEEDKIKSDKLLLKLEDAERKEIECPFFKKGILYAS
jgi:tetratricopeptide (TPR) repeat protein